MEEPMVGVALEREEGQVLVWLIVLLPLLLLVVAMVFEGGMMYRTYRIAQAAADAGAHAAAMHIDRGAYLRSDQIRLDPGATEAARQAALRNSPAIVSCGAPAIAGNRVELVCRAALRPTLLPGPVTFVTVRGRARPGWGISGEGQ